VEDTVDPEDLVACETPIVKVEVDGRVAPLGHEVPLAVGLCWPHFDARELIGHLDHLSFAHAALETTDEAVGLPPGTPGAARFE
jgi:hypothetical protein